MNDAMPSSEVPDDDNSFGRRTVLAALLTGVAGFLDAVGYVQLGQLYVSFMSGNSTHLGIAFATEQWHGAVGVCAIIGAFVAGAAIGTAIGDASNRNLHINVIAAELILFLVAILLTIADYSGPALALISVAMGMQNVLHQRIAGADIGKSFITGALFALGQSLARIFRRRDAAVQAAENALSWVSFVVGAVLGAITLAHMGLTGSLVAGAALLCVLGILIVAGWT